MERNSYRDKLAVELKSTPKDMRRAVLDEAIQSAEYIESFLGHSKPRWVKRERKIKEREPVLDFNPDDIEDFKQKLNKLAEYIYSTITAYNREGGYDPQKGHMLCGEITDKFIAYLKSRGIDSRRINRIYEVKNPVGEYDDSFGHVYLIIDRPGDHTLVDPTYLQWVSEKERKGRPSVLFIRFKNREDLKIQFDEVPIKQKIVLPFYLGFDSEEAKQFFRDSAYTVISEERARLDD